MEVELKRAEEQKRDRAYGPHLRWQHYLEFIAWCEDNKPEQRRNRPRWRDEKGRVRFY